MESKDRENHFAEFFSEMFCIRIAECFYVDPVFPI